jgi:hypothetical protein
MAVLGSWAWWPLYLFVVAVYSSLFFGIGDGLRYLAGWETSEYSMEVAIASLYGYLFLVSYFPVMFAINKMLADKYPFPWEERNPPSPKA